MGYAYDAASLTPAATSRRCDVQPDTWVVVPIGDAMPALGDLAGFDTLEQAQAVVAGLCGFGTGSGGVAVGSYSLTETSPSWGSFFPSGRLSGGFAST